MDSLTRYASRPATQPSRCYVHSLLVAVAVVAVFFLAHLDLIIWGV
jgi:hypothetical protein